MNEPLSRPAGIEAEARRIADDMMESVRDDYGWRSKMAESLSRIEANGKYTQLMIEAHAKLDDERFANIKERVIYFSSSATSGEKSGIQLEGASNFVKFIGGLIVIISAIGGLAYFLASLGSKHP